MNISLIQKLKVYIMNPQILNSIALTSIISLFLCNITIAQIIDTSSIRHIPLETYTHTPENLNKKSGEWVLIQKYSLNSDDNYLDWSNIRIQIRENNSIASTKGWVILEDFNSNYWIQNEITTTNKTEIVSKRKDTQWKSITTNKFKNGHDISIKHILMHIVFESASLPNKAHLELYASQDIVMGKTLLLTAPNKQRIYLSSETGPSFTNLTIEEKPEHNGWESGDFVSNQPRIQATIQDSTATISTYSIQITQDNTIIESINQNITESTNSYSLDFTPANSLSPGTYSVTLSAVNALNEPSSREFTLKVASDIQIMGLIAGPIPYNYLNGNLSIEYQLSQNANVDIRIYSIAGEKIKTWNFDSGSEGALQGFNKLTWNGKTTSDTYISNGPYVIYMTASNNSGTASSKSKIVVLR